MFPDILLVLRVWTRISRVNTINLSRLQHSNVLPFSTTDMSTHFWFRTSLHQHSHWHILLFTTTLTQLVPVKAKIYPWVGQAVQGHQPEEGLHLETGCKPKWNSKLDHNEWGGAKDVASNYYQGQVGRANFGPWDTPARGPEIRDDEKSRNGEITLGQVDTLVE